MSTAELWNFCSWLLDKSMEIMAPIYVVAWGAGVLRILKRV